MREQHRQWLMCNAVFRGNYWRDSGMRSLAEWWWNYAYKHAHIDEYGWIASLTWSPPGG